MNEEQDTDKKQGLTKKQKTKLAVVLGVIFVLITVAMAVVVWYVIENDVDFKTWPFALQPVGEIATEI